MKATITNLGTVPVPLTCAEGKGFAASLDPGMPYMLDNEDITVVTIGDNPAFTEDLKKAMGDVWDLAMKLLAFWREPKPTPQGGVGEPVVRVRIVAGEGNSLRVTGDDKNLDQEVVPGSTYDATMKNYVDVMQLGLAQANVHMNEAPLKETTMAFKPFPPKAPGKEKAPPGKAPPFGKGAAKPFPPKKK